jgi:lycopene beta-cyclase
MSRPAPPLIIAGGGLAGCLAALEMARKRTEIPILLVEKARAFGGNHVWSFFDSDIRPDHRFMVDALSPDHWPQHEVRFPKRRRTLAIGYSSIRSAQLDHAVRLRLQPHQYRLGAGVAEMAPDHVVLDNGERIEALGVIDARGPGRLEGLDLAWQKFVGRTYRFAQPHRCARPVIMDATVVQSDGYRFVYSLPFGASEMMIEDTYYSSSPLLDPEALCPGIDTIAAAAGEAQCVDQETGVLPVVLGGSVEPLWRGGPAVARFGLRGGFFHPTTGYSLPDAVRNAALLAAQRDFSSAALHDLFGKRARQLWDKRRFFQLLNRMLFHAAEPRERYRILEHFYRLPEPVIGRFYAAELTALDKLRILSGRPPVPVGRALAAIRRRAA